jgi:hypothetical protein
LFFHVFLGIFWSTTGAEMEEEIVGLAKASKLPTLFVRGVQLLYELQTTMVPVVNYTQAALPKEFEGLSRMSWTGPGASSSFRDQPVFWFTP